MTDATPNFALLCWTAAAVGFVHTILGPDHYLPFVAMARVGRWSTGRTLAITALCGVGHVLGSIALGLVGIFLGVAVFRLESIEASRGALAGWLLLAFGLLYTVWGVWRAVRNRPHSHLHVHANGTVHSHDHTHVGEHVHVHETVGAARTHAGGRAHEHGHEHGHAHTQGHAHALDHAAPRDESPDARTAVSMTPWILFTIFVFGPCEPLIPLVMYPAARGAMYGVVAVSLIFAAVTIGTMMSAVLMLSMGLTRIRIAGLERYTHAAAGLTVLACGAAIQFGL